MSVKEIGWRNKLLVWKIKIPCFLIFFRGAKQENGRRKDRKSIRMSFASIQSIQAETNEVSLKKIGTAQFPNPLQASYESTVARINTHRTKQRPDYCLSCKKKKAQRTILINNIWFFYIME